MSELFDETRAEFNLPRSGAMPRFHKPDPYNGFKCDVERRRALNAKVYSAAVVGVAFAVSHSFTSLQEVLLWLKALLP